MRPKTCERRLEPERLQANALLLQVELVKLHLGAAIDAVRRVTIMDKISACYSISYVDKWVFILDSLPSLSKGEKGVGGEFSRTHVR